MKKLIFGCCIVILTASCNRSGSYVNVADLTRQFINAWNSKDTTKIDSLLADDVQLLQADAHYSGKVQVMQNWVSQSVGVINNLKTNAVSTDADGHMAYEAGTFSVDVAAPNSQPAVGEGNYILIWKFNSNGSWKVSYVQLEDLPLHK